MSNESTSNGFEAQPEGIAEKITSKRFNNGKIEMLVKWMGIPPDDSTWVPLEKLTPYMQLVADFEVELFYKTAKEDGASTPSASSDHKEEVGGQATSSEGNIPMAKDHPPLPVAKNPITMGAALQDEAVLSASFGQRANPTAAPLNVPPTSSTIDKASTLISLKEQARQWQANKNVSKFAALLNPQMKLTMPDNTATKENRASAISDSDKDTSDEDLMEIHGMQIPETAPQKAKKNAKKRRRESSGSDDDLDLDLLPPANAVFGLARGLELEKVIHSYRLHQHKFLFVTWKGLDGVDAVPFDDLKELYPAQVLEYFEKLEHRYE